MRRISQPDLGPYCCVVLCLQFLVPIATIFETMTATCQLSLVVLNLLMLKCRITMAEGSSWVHSITIGACICMTLRAVAVTLPSLCTCKRDRGVVKAARILRKEKSEVGLSNFFSLPSVLLEKERKKRKKRGKRKRRRLKKGVKRRRRRKKHDGSSISPQVNAPYQ